MYPSTVPQSALDRKRDPLSTSQVIIDPTPSSICLAHKDEDVVGCQRIRLKLFFASLWFFYFPSEVSPNPAMYRTAMQLSLLCADGMCAATILGKAHLLFQLATGEGVCLPAPHSC